MKAHPQTVKRFARHIERAKAALRGHCDDDVNEDDEHGGACYALSLWAERVATMFDELIEIRAEQRKRPELPEPILKELDELIDTALAEGRKTAMMAAQLWQDEAESLGYPIPYED